MNAIFAANPESFLDNDPNKLKAGSWLTIPSLDGTAPVVAAAAPEPLASPSPAAMPGSQRRFCSSVPNSSMGTPNSELLTETMVP